MTWVLTTMSLVLTGWGDTAGGVLMTGSDLELAVMGCSGILTDVAVHLLR